MKKFLLLCAGCVTGSYLLAQSVFSCGTTEVSQEEFINAFNRNNSDPADKAAALKEYLNMYAAFKLKVKAARDMKLDTTEALQHDVENFRTRLENDFMLPAEQILAKVNFKMNPSIDEGYLGLYADSAAYSKSGRQWPIEKEMIFSLNGSPVKGAEWLQYAKAYKLNKDSYKGETNQVLLQRFIQLTAENYYRKHLEEYNNDFKFQLQEFREGNLFYQVMEKKVWNKTTAEAAELKAYYEANKDHFLWEQGVEVVLVTAKSYAYADFARESMKSGQSWEKIMGGSEGMIVADSGRYEMSLLPLPQDTKLEAGVITPVMKIPGTSNAGFVKVIRIFPPKQPRSFDEAKSLVMNEYQQKLEENWMKELTARYPVKVNTAVFQSLLK